MQGNFSRILVPIDFSDVSINALKFATSLAHETQSSIIILHVVQGHGGNQTELNREEDKPMCEAVNEQVQALLKAEEITIDMLEIVVASGKIHEVIRKLADIKNIELIVMGTIGEVNSITRNFKKYVMGTNAFRTVEKSNIPVITLRKEFPRKEVKTIVLPIDVADDATTHKVDYARIIGRAFMANVHVLAMTEDHNHTTDIAERLTEITNQVCGVMSDAGLTVITSVIHSSDIPYDIMSYAEKVKADMIVIMAKKAQFLEEFLLNSDEKTIITKSRIPVLSVKTKLPNS